MTAQPLRSGALALGYVVATATLVLVTVLASNLVLSVVTGFGPAQPSAKPEKSKAVLVSVSDRCGDRHWRGQERDGRRAGAARCGGRGAAESGERP